MDSYKIQAFLHIAVALVAIGVTFVYPFLQGWAEQRGVGATRLALQFGEHLEKIVVLPGALLVFLFGLGLIFDDKTGYKDDFPLWLGVAIAWYVLVVAISLGIQRPTVARAIAALDGVPDDGDFPPAYMEASRKMQVVGGFMGFSAIAITFLMVWKPWQ